MRPHPPQAIGVSFPLLFSLCFCLGSAPRLLTLPPRATLPHHTGENGAAIFDFTAVWCGPCKMISPVYEQLASDLPDVAFYKLDIDNPDLIEAITDANISSVPTFIGYKGGRYVGEFTGADRTKLATLLAKVSS